jgi:hypothetical protein
LGIGNSKPLLDGALGGGPLLPPLEPEPEPEPELEDDDD